MFQKGKRAIAFFLACFLCVQMSGCGGTPASSGDAANSSTVSGSTESADSAQSDSSSAASDPQADASETAGSSTRFQRQRDSLKSLVGQSHPAGRYGQREKLI